MDQDSTNDYKQCTSLLPPLGPRDVRSPATPNFAGLLRRATSPVFGWLRSRWALPLLLMAVLIAGAYLRLSHINWDEGAHIHPDERFLTMVEDALDLPKSLGQFFDSTTSPMSPYNKGYGFFVYGTLPIFIVRVVAEVVHRFNQSAHLWMAAPDVPMDLAGYGGVNLVGRALSGLFDLACLPLIFIVGRRLYGRKVGLLAALLLAFSVLPLQQSHFFTVDTFGTFFALLTFYFAVRVLQGGQRGYRGGGWGAYVAMGASLGASIACRINLVPLAGIALLAAAVRAWDDWHSASDEDSDAPGGQWLNTVVQATLFRLLLMGLVALAVFRVAQPYAFGGKSLLDFSLSDAWRDNMRQIQLLISGNADSPPGHQWANRTPFVFPFVNMVVWGLGIPLGLTAWAGWALAVLQVIRRLTIKTDARALHCHVLPVAWIGGMFVWQGLQYVQSMRYLLPIYPLLAMMAAWLLWWLADRARAWRAEPALAALTPAEGEAAPATVPSNPTTKVLVRLRNWAPAMAYGLLFVVAVTTMLWGWGFTAIYRRPLTRITASRWIFDNVPPGTVIANEHWDDGLPLRVDGKDGFGSYGYKGLSTSSDGSMQMYAEDTPEKREQLYQWLDEADYIVLSSNRLWGSIPRLPMRYPMTTLYYKLLFEGKLGFKEVLRVTSFPTVLGIQFDDTSAEEAFSVYDHAQVRVYKKTPQYNQALVRSYFDPVDLENTILMWPKQVSAAPTALLFTPEDAARQQAGGTWADIFNVNSLVNRSQLVSVLVWLIMLELLGLIALPLAFVVLRSLGDRGYGVSKVIGVLVLAWLSWLGPSLKLAPYRNGWIWLCLGFLVAVSGYLAWRNRAGLLGLLRERAALLITEEGLFLALFALFLLIRWGNPDLWHPARGGEKPMDFAYLNAVIKSTIFPPYDPWQSGGYLNYYYFGFVVIGTLVKLTGIVPWVAYNLAVPTLFALTGTGAFSVAFNLADGDPATVFRGEEPPTGGLRIGSLLAGLTGAFFVAIIGNLGNARLLAEQFAARAAPGAASGTASLAAIVSGIFRWLAGRAALDFPNDWWFWNASRVIPDTINEFPFFTFVYADLHAHMIAFPIALLGLAIAVALVRSASPQKNGGPDGRPADEETGPEPAASPSEPSPWRIDLPELFLLAAMGFVTGALRATNTWEFPTYILIGLMAVSVVQAQRRLLVSFPSVLDARLAFLFRAGVSVLWRVLIIVAAASIAFYPYTSHYATAYAGLQSWKEAKTRIPDYLTMFGFFLALVVIYLVSELAVQREERQLPGWLRPAIPFLAASAILVLGAGWIMGVRIWLVALPLAGLAVVLACSRDIPPVRRFALLLIALSLAITMGVEVVRQKDDIGRMNTVFKFYLQAWILFGVASAFGLASWASRAALWRPSWRRLALVVTALLFAAVMLYPPTAAHARIGDRFSAEASPRGLDGMAFMDRAQYIDNERDLRLADDKAAIEWMQRNVAGSPVILEGNTPAYRWGNRFSIYTGLPAVQGWDWHEKQQRSVVPQAAIDRRLSHVREMYDTTDMVRAQHLLGDYGVAYIIVGELERAYYNPDGLRKFDTMVDQGYLELAYPPPGAEANGAVRIYRVADRMKSLQPIIDGPIGPQPVPTPTGLPETDLFLSPEPGVTQ